VCSSKNALSSKARSIGKCRKKQISNDDMESREKVVAVAIAKTGGGWVGEMKWKNKRSKLTTDQVVSSSSLLDSRSATVGWLVGRLVGWTCSRKLNQQRDRPWVEELFVPTTPPPPSSSSLKPYRKLLVASLIS